MIQGRKTTGDNAPPTIRATPFLMVPPFPPATREGGAIFQDILPLALEKKVCSKILVKLGPGHRRCHTS